MTGPPRAPYSLVRVTAFQSHGDSACVGQRTQSYRDRIGGRHVCLSRAEDASGESGVQVAGLRLTKLTWTHSEVPQAAPMTAVAAQEDLVAGAAKSWFESPRAVQHPGYLHHLGRSRRARTRRGRPCLWELRANDIRALPRSWRNNLARRWWRPDCSPVHWFADQFGHLMAPKGVQYWKSPNYRAKLVEAGGIENPSRGESGEKR
jgi:hypothetical protein